MVDFKKLLASPAPEQPTAPAEIYKRLDRASDKGPLRPSQDAVLGLWHGERRAERDVILKLHTGEGKTLIGLLILQSKLNELSAGAGRALYLCPNNFLVAQTSEQARQFGVTCVEVEDNGDLPATFLDGKAILVAPIQKLFNGLTKFGLRAASERVDAIVLDDAHACIDAIKDACTITVKRDHEIYTELLRLFADDLEHQGVGTFAEIRQRNTRSFLPVPYWAWMNRYREVADVLAQRAHEDAIRFGWPLIRDILRDCLCVVSGRELVIAPYAPPIDAFGSFARAAHRVYMSATITDDSFLVRGLGLPSSVVQNPLTVTEPAWSGEKMVLLPSQVDENLTDAEVVNMFARPRAKAAYGRVVLVPSFEQTKDWKTEGAIVASGADIEERVQALREGDRERTLVVANRYDGIDLPDDSCRLLVLDGKPFSESLLDRYAESCRPNSEVIARRAARIIEQGMGRAVRGEKDYCVVVIAGADLVRAMRTREDRSFFSPQTRKQVEIGLSVAGIARDELAASGGAKTGREIVSDLVRQSLRRDEGWKEFYAQKMNELSTSLPEPVLSTLFGLEYDAEQAYMAGDLDRSVEAVREILDSQSPSQEERGWYLQTMARYRYIDAKGESMKIQEAAHRANRYLLRPHGGAFTRLEPLPLARVEGILQWARDYGSRAAVLAAVDDICSALSFGVRSEFFESSLQELGIALGFSSERPDKEWKAGPDNLWALREGEYLLLECKSEVEVSRSEISKTEAGQMNTSAAWFTESYQGASVTRVIVIPTRLLAEGAAFSDAVAVLRDPKLGQLKRNFRAFFRELTTLDLRNVPDRAVYEMLRRHYLDIGDLQSRYYDEPRRRRGTANR